MTTSPLPVDNFISGRKKGWGRWKRQVPVSLFNKISSSVDFCLNALGQNETGEVWGNEYFHQGPLLSKRKLVALLLKNKGRVAIGWAETPGSMCHNVLSLLFLLSIHRMGGASHSAPSGLLNPSCSAPKPVPP